MLDNAKNIFKGAEKWSVHLTIASSDIKSNVNNNKH